MPYIVDGNNVMGQTPGWHRDRSKARRTLLEQLAGLGRSKRVRITVVFDGEPDRDFPEASAHQGVRILYAARGSDADARIERLVSASTDPRGLTVVTSDRRLALAVRSHGASVLRSGEFRKRLEDAQAAGAHGNEETQRDSGDIEEWLRYFGAGSVDGVQQE